MTSDALQSAAMVIEIDSMATTIVCGDEADAARSGVAAMRSDQSDLDCCVARFATRTPVVPPPDRYSRTMKISLFFMFLHGFPDHWSSRQQSQKPPMYRQVPVGERAAFKQTPQMFQKRRRRRRILSRAGEPDSQRRHREMITSRNCLKRCVERAASRRVVCSAESKG